MDTVQGQGQGTPVRDREHHNTAQNVSVESNGGMKGDKCQLTSQYILHLLRSCSSNHSVIAAEKDWPTVLCSISLMF
jgi:hypothetical protein